MKVCFVVARRGYELRMNEYRFLDDEKVLFELAVFWRARAPRRVWRLMWCSNYVAAAISGRIRAERIDGEGRRVGWELRVPIHRT